MNDLHLEPGPDRVSAADAILGIPPLPAVPDALAEVRRLLRRILALTAPRPDARPEPRP